MKRLTYLAFAALLLAGLAGCTTYNYYTAAINKTNLSAYHTYAWMPPADQAKYKDIDDKTQAKIKDAANNALVSKGLKLNQSNPDFVINYTITVGRGSRTTYYSPYYGGWGWGGYGGWGWGGYGGFYGGWGYRGGWGWGGYGGWGWGGYGYGWGYPWYGGIAYAEKEHYKEGTLIIDLIDTHTRKIVWRGFGVGEVHKDPQQNIEELPKVVAGVLEQLQLMPESKIVKLPDVSL